MVEGYFEKWAIPLKGQEEERLRLRHEGVTAWDNKNYKSQRLEDLAKNKHSEYVLRRTLKKINDFYFLGRLDIHSDIIIKFLKEERDIDLLAEPDKFHAFLRGREIGEPFAISRLSLLNPNWTTQEPFRNHTTSIEISEGEKLANCDGFWEAMKNDEYRAILIKGAKSIGKTTGVKYYLDSLPQTKPILCLTHRQSLAENLAENLNLTNYKKLTGSYNNPEATRMSLCINSLIKLESHIDRGRYKDAIIILDEIMSLLPTISYRGEGIKMNQIRHKIIRALKKLFKVASKVIIIDADLESFVAEFCFEIFGKEATHIVHADRPLPYSKPVKVISHNNKRCLGQYVNSMLNNPEVYPAIMFLASLDGTREAKKLYEALYPNFKVEDYEQEIPEGMHPEVLMLNSGTGKWPKSKEFFQDPNGYIERMRPRLIVATNIVDAGLSIDKFDYFKTVVVATTFNHISPLTMAQQAPRLRDFEPSRIFFIPQNVIRTDLDLEYHKELTIKAQQIKWLDEHLDNVEARAELYEALDNLDQFLKFQRFLGIANKDIKKLWDSLYDAKETLLSGEALDCKSSPYLDLLFDAIAFDCKMKNNFSEVIKESLLLDDNELEYETFTYTSQDEDDDGYPSFSQEEIEQIISRENKDKKEIHQNGDEIDKLVYEIDREFGLKAHTIPDLLEIYQNPKKLDPLQKRVKLAKDLFWKDMHSRMIENPYVPDWEEHEHKAQTLELAGFKIFERKLIDAKVSRGNVSQVLNNFKDDDKLKKRTLKQFFSPKKKDILKNSDVIELLQRAFGIKFERRRKGYHRISDLESLSYKLLSKVLNREYLDLDH